MNDLERWKIDELKARYELEPTLRDVFVEGNFDSEVISMCCRACGHLDRKVYGIDNVEITSELLTKHGLSNGNKQRVIALARELANIPLKCDYRCFVDKDLDHWFGPLENTTRLVWSEFSSIELYFFTNELLKDILLITARSKINSWDDYLESLISTLRDLYVLRLVDRELSLSLSWLPPSRCLSRAGSRIIFDLGTYTERLLNKNKKTKERGKFEKSLIKWKKVIAGDYRNFIRGHDFIDMLAWTVSEFRGVKEFSSAIPIQRLLVLLARRVPNILTALS